MRKLACYSIVIEKTIVFFFLIFIRCYQLIISPFLGKHCRFYPSCSDYAVLSLKSKGFVKGLILVLLRLLRCHPFCSGGIDFPNKEL